MKKVLSLILLLVMVISVFGLTACEFIQWPNNPNNPDNPDNPDEPEEVIGAFGSFDEINTKNSYLGYGIDIINASAINSANVAMNYPIFDIDKLMAEQLLKANEHYAEFRSIEGMTIEEFCTNMSNSISISSGKSASAKGQIKGVDVEASASFSNGLKTGFTQATDEVESQYFLRVMAENQSYWLILQSSEARYKEILSDEFKADLYNPAVSAARLFEKYGTHLLTSVAMGGSIYMDYTMYSYSKETTRSNYVEVSGQFKTNVSASFGKYAGSAGQEDSFENAFNYQQLASKYEIRVDTNISSAGGDSYGINSESTLFEHYFDWQNSLDEYPVIIGIKDVNSLYPIWNLIDSSKDKNEYTWIDKDGENHTGTRAEQLYSYFQEYGIDSYQNLCEYYDIKPMVEPTDITNIKLNGVDYQEGEFAKIAPGSTYKITCNVLPGNANRYNLSFTSSKPSIATVDNEGTITVSDDALTGSEFEVKITAGSISKTIKLKVTKTYDVVFHTLCDIPDISIQADGSKLIEAPYVERDGYEIVGWYRNYSENGKYSDQFDFEKNIVTEDLELYAKWVQIDTVGHEVTFTFNKDNAVTEQSFADGTDEKVSRAYNNSSDVLESVPKAEYYVFNGWCNSDGILVIDASGTLQKGIDGFTTSEGKWNLSSNIVLYAQWSKVKEYQNYKYITNKNILTIDFDNSSDSYLLLEDIDASDKNLWNLGTFKGELNGNGKTISGFSVSGTLSTKGYYGMFAILDGATVKDLTFTNVNINCTNGNSNDTIGIGTLAGKAINNSKIINVSVSGTVTLKGSGSGVSVAGGLVGHATSSLFEDCTNNATVYAGKGSANAGGIVGVSYGISSAKCEYINCKNNGSITAHLMVFLGHARAAGIVGRCQDSYSYFDVTCSNTGTIIAKGDAGATYDEADIYNT